MTLKSKTKFELISEFDPIEILFDFNYVSSTFHNDELRIWMRHGSQHKHNTIENIMRYSDIQNRRKFQ